MIKPKVLFLLSQYPDIDHLCPVIYILARTNLYNLKILSYGDRADLFEDERIIFLIKTFNIKVSSIGDYYPIKDSFFYKLEKYKIYWALKCKQTKPYFFFGKNLKSIFFPRFYYFRLLRLTYELSTNLILNNSEWGVRAYESEKIDMLITVHSFTTPYIKSLIDALHKNKIKTISIPHSVYQFKEYDFHINQKPIKAEYNYENFPWKVVFFENQNRFNFLNSNGVLETRLHKFGSLRFTYWWEKKLINIYKNQFPKINQNKNTILFISSGPNIVNQDKLELLMEYFSENCRNINVIVKLHARRSFHYQYKDSYPGHIHIVGKEFSTTKLIELSNFVFFAASSASLSSLLQNKVPIYLKFLLKMDISAIEYSGVDICYSFDSLKKILTEISQYRFSSKVNHKNIDNFLKNIVWGEMDNEVKIRENYLDFFQENLLKNKSLI